MPKRPQNENELQKREAVGVIRASRFVRKYAHSHRAITIKMEKENKNRYRAVLAQADATSDLEPLKAIIYDGIIDRYKGVSMRYYSKKKE